MPRILRLLLPTDRWTRFLLVPALVFIATATDRNYQTDLWHHLARGRAIVFAWGEYLGWSLAPRYTVFMDGRIEIIPDEVWMQYATVTRGRADWQDILAHYHVDFLLLDAAGYHHDLLPLVERSPDWRQVERRGDAVQFGRRGTSLAPAPRTAGRITGVGHRTPTE